jgi:hypothetical protein
LSLGSPVFFPQYKKAGADGLMGAMPQSDKGDGIFRYTEKLAPSVNLFLADASRQDGRVCAFYIMTYILLKLSKKAFFCTSSEEN